jgi:hypothetical protein
MSDLMCSARLLATDSLFRAACKTDPRSALAQRGLGLTEPELKALHRVWALIIGRMDDGELPPIGLPELGWFL